MTARCILVWTAVLMLFMFVQSAAEEDGYNHVQATALETDYDAYFVERMETLHIPGAVIAVVHAGDLIFSKGYGHACVAAQRPVHPEETLFRIGSVTKVITATAVMQCVERGLLNLHRDVNTYLTGWQIPPHPGGPITLWHLLTHTAGFDDRFLELGAPSPDQLEPLGAYLQRRLPDRVQAPGEVFNYSNFGVTLAAYLVEIASGKSFYAFVEETIFQPLGMHPGGFDQPLSPEMRDRLAYTYVREKDAYRPSAWRDAASQVAPAGSYAATAEDMARFMIAHLQQGRYESIRILEEATAHEMHTPQFSAHPALRQQQGLGFHIREHNGQRLVWHTGRVDMFTAQLVLVPDLSLGVFVVTNADAGSDTRIDVVDVLAKHFFPGSVADDVVIEDIPRAQLQAVSGAYRQVRHVRDGFEKLGFLGQEIYFRPDASGHLRMKHFGAKTPIDVWGPVAGHKGRLYAAMASEQPRRLAFVEDDSGNVTYACMDREAYTSSLTAYERLHPWEHTGLHLAAAIFCLLVFLIALLRWPFSSLFRRLRGAPLADSAAGHLERRLHGLMGLLFLGFCLGLGLCLAVTDLYLLAFGLPVRLWLLLWLPWLAALCWAICLPTGYCAMQTALRQGSWRRMLVTPLFSVAGGLFLLLLRYWNLI